MARRSSKKSLDALDRQLILELEDDARISYTDLASNLGINRVTAQKRLNRIVEKGYINIVATVYPPAFGYMTYATLGISVNGGKADEVSDILATLPCTRDLAITTGRYDIVGWAYFTDNQQMLDMISREMGQIPNVINIETNIILRLLRSRWAKSGEDIIPTEHGAMNRKIDKLDLLIIRELELNPRITVVELSKRLGAKRSTTQNRLKSLLDDKLINFVTTPDLVAMGYGVRSLIYVKVQSNQLIEITNQLLSLHKVKLVHVISGPFQLLLWADFLDSADLEDFLKNELTCIPGVVDTEIATITSAMRRRFPNVIDVQPA